MSINVTELRPGNYFLEDGNIYLVLDILLNKTAMRKMVAKVKIKNVRTGSITDMSANSGYQVETIRLEKKKMNYLYDGGDFLVFMDNATYYFSKTTNRELYHYRNILEYHDGEYVLTNPISDKNIREMLVNMDDTDAEEFEKFVERNWGKKVSKYDDEKKTEEPKKRTRKTKTDMKPAEA